MSRRDLRPGQGGGRPWRRRGDPPGDRPLARGRGPVEKHGRARALLGPPGPWAAPAAGPRTTRARSPVSWAVPEAGTLIGRFDAVGEGSADESSVPAVCWPARLA